MLSADIVFAGFIKVDYCKVGVMLACLVTLAQSKKSCQCTWDISIHQNGAISAMLRHFTGDSRNMDANADADANTDANANTDVEAKANANADGNAELLSGIAFCGLI